MKINAGEALMGELKESGLEDVFKNMCKISETKEYREFADKAEKGEKSDEEVA